MSFVDYYKKSTPWTCSIVVKSVAYPINSMLGRSGWSRITWNVARAFLLTARDGSSFVPLDSAAMIFSGLFYNGAEGLNFTRLDAVKISFLTDQNQFSPA